MAKYQSIAVIYGSDSSEWEVSCRSGEFTASRIDEFQYDVYEVFARFGKWNLVAMRKANSMRQAFPEGAQPVVDKSDFSVMVLGEKIKFDFAYIMQHGAPGETGLLQGYFEMLGIPHSTCSAFVTTVAFDKYACKSYLRGKDLVKMAPDAIIHRGEDIEEFCSATVAALGLPLFVKPTRAGSSFGITKVAKYNGLSQEICPAPVSEELTLRVQETSRRIYRYLGCKGLVRMDYLSADDGLYFLEVNIIPGMTNASLVPKMIRTSGQTITEFLTTIIENS